GLAIFSGVCIRSNKAKNYWKIIFESAKIIGRLRAKKVKHCFVCPIKRNYFRNLDFSMSLQRFTQVLTDINLLTIILFFFFFQFKQNQLQDV
ncbi:hypothetical protein Mgra_00004544, partial [Meloidogyne graminicola]